MRQLFRLAAIAAPAFLLTGCATMSVSSYVQRGLDLSRYRTYEWAASDSTTMIDGNNFNDRFQRAVEDQLQRRGFERSRSSNPDLMIKYGATVDRRMDFERAGADYGYCSGGNCRASVVDYDELTVVVDMFDARTNRAIWRGWVQDSVEHMTNAKEKDIADAVARMFGKWPPHDAELTQYQTFGWAPAGRLETGDPRLDDNPFFMEQVHASLEKALAAKGFVHGSPPDLLIHFDASVAQRVEFATTYDQSGPCQDCEAYVYDAAIFTIDFIDARTNQLVWRGWADSNVDGVIDDQDRLERAIEKVVAAILGRYPSSN